MGGTGSGRRKKIFSNEISKKSNKKQTRTKKEPIIIIQLKHEASEPEPESHLPIEIKQEPFEDSTTENISMITTSEQNDQETAMLTCELESNLNLSIQTVISQSETIINEEPETVQLKPEAKVNESNELVFGEPTIKMKSWVWQYYNPCPSEKLAKCKLCNSILPRPLSSTSRLSNHLVKVHSKEIKKTITKTKSAPLPPTVDVKKSPVEQIKIKTEPINEIKRRRALDVRLQFEKRVKLQLLDDKFQESISSIKKYYEDPQIKQLIENNELAIRLTDAIKQSLNDPQVEHICLSVENWKNEQNDTYIGLTAHYIDFNLKEVHYSFGLKLVEYATLFSCETMINQIMTDFNFKEKVKYFVSNESYDFSFLKSFPCACQTLNLCVRDVLNVHDDLDSNQLIPALIIKCQDFAHQFATITNTSIDLSFNLASFYCIMDSLVTNKDSLDKILKDELSLNKLKEFYPTPDEFIHIKDFLKVFKTLKRLKIELGSKKFSNCSILLPGIFHYLKYLNELKLETDTVERLKQRLITSIRTNFHYLLEENLDLFLSISFLDHRFKLFTFCEDDSLADEYHERVRQFLTGLCIKYAFDLQEFKTEYNNYLKCKTTQFCENSLDFFRNSGRSNKFYILTKMAKKLYCITTSALRADYIFNSNGKIRINQARNRLDKSKIEFITFVKDNLDLCF